ncbi:MAG: glycosyltransferase family 4 protein, partial [Acidimicrobiales bacterium]
MTAESMAQLGHEVDVLVCASRSEARDLDAGGASVHLRPLRPARSDRLRRVVNERAGVALSFPFELARLRRRFDLIHAPEFMAPTLLLPPTRRTAVVVRLSTPTIVTFESNASPVDMRVLAADRLERWAVRRSDVVAAPNSLLVDHLRERGWLRHEKVVFAPTPVNLDAWSGLRPPDEAGPTILAVGRVEHNKGPDLVVEAAAKLVPRVPGLRVVFVGRSSGRVRGRPYM